MTSDPIPSTQEDLLDETRTICAVLKRLYPQNPDIVLFREARRIAEELVAAGLLESRPGAQP